MSLFNSEQQWANFWVGRVGWHPSWAAKRIADSCDPTSLIADIGGAHGRDSFWLSAKGFRVVLLEPNAYSLKMALQRLKDLRVHVDIVRSALPNLPVRDKCFNAVTFYWGLHSYPDEEKLEALVEIERVIVNGGLLFSASFGSWSGHSVPLSIHLVQKKEDFIAWHEKAGFRTLRVTEIADETRTFEKSWCGEFKVVKT
ncbi:MAG: class I SAM-dependent methyltransferase [Dehalococcoidia bacterium]